MRLTSLRVLCLLLGGAAHVPAAPAEELHPAAVVEMFTSKYCPSCPAAEARMKGVAQQNADLLVLFAHVDYWNRGELTDPYGLPEVTQRQYDYSNTLTARPGQVFTPMPVINGRFVATAPIWLSWERTLKRAREAGSLAKLSARRVDGGLQVKIPDGVDFKGTELWVMGLEPVEDAAPRRVLSLVQVDAGKASVSLPKALTPDAPELLVLLQEKGVRGVTGISWLK